MATTQKAYVLTEKQGAQKLIDWPIPSIKENELLVRIESASLNPVDWKIAQMGIYIDKFPTILGSDGAGVVVEVGSKVTKFQKGERVFFQGNVMNPQTTTFQQYCVVAEFIAAKIPDNVSFDQAATIPVSGMAAAVSLFKDLEIKYPWVGKHTTGMEHILIWGGATSAGRMAIQLATLAGLTVIATASPANHKVLLDLGATHVVNYRASDAVAQIRALAGDDLVYAFDTVGAVSSQQCWEALSSTRPSKLVYIAAPPDVLGHAEKYAPKQVSILHGLGSGYMYPEIGEGFITAVAGWLAEGRVLPNNVMLLEGGLRGIQTGQEMQTTGKVSNVKLVIHPQETI